MNDDLLKQWALRRRYGSRATIEPDHPKHVEYWNGLTDEDKARLRRHREREGDYPKMSARVDS